MEHKDLNRLKLVLVEKKRTGTWLAEQLGVSYVTVSKWCSNITQPTLPTLDRIAELLKCDKKDLIND
jgi:DNA-binding Xre family transcriptional regulator